MRALPLAAVAFGVACAARPVAVSPPAPAPRTDADEARAALLAFVAAAEERRFEACYEMLAAPLRARYTAARLAADWRLAETVAGERLARARASAAAAPQIRGDQASFPVGTGRAVLLVREAAGWRVASLD